MSTPSEPGYFDTLISAPNFSQDPMENRQKQHWRRIAEDIHRSTTIASLLEARGKAEGYILGLIDAGHLSSRDMDRDYLILSAVQRRRDFLQKLLTEYGY